MFQHCVNIPPTVDREGNEVALRDDEGVWLPHRLAPAAAVATTSCQDQALSSV